MGQKLQVGHPFYFPTQVVLLDDDPDFLDGISLMLNKELSYKLFQSASSALSYVNTAHKHVDFLKRCYTSYKTGPSESDSLSHIDIGKIHHEVLNSARFQTTSIVIVDFSMPEMNGLEFLMSLKNPFIKKILLTGQADMGLAIKAFNKQLIDQFIDKHDPKLKEKLNSIIGNFQEQYFRSSYKMLTDPVIANNMDGFLLDVKFQTFFQQIRDKLNCVEYYMIDSPRAGFLMVDANGERKCLLIHTNQSISDHCKNLVELNAPSELISKVKIGELLPSFDTNSEDTEMIKTAIQDWQHYYYPGMKIESTMSYFATIVSDSVLPSIHGKSIIPYADFIEANCMLNEVVH